MLFGKSGGGHTPTRAKIPGVSALKNTFRQDRYRPTAVTTMCLLYHLYCQLLLTYLCTLGLYGLCQTYAVATGTSTSTLYFWPLGRMKQGSSCLGGLLRHTPQGCKAARLCKEVGLHSITGQQMHVYLELPPTRRSFASLTFLGTYQDRISLVKGDSNVMPKVHYVVDEEEGRPCSCLSHTLSPASC